MIFSNMLNWIKNEFIEFSETMDNLFKDVDIEDIREIIDPEGREF